MKPLSTEPLTGNKPLDEALWNLPEIIHKAPGRFLYSAKETLTKGDYYLLGINPGGDPLEEYEPLTYEIPKWFAKSDNAFLNEKWKPCKLLGQAPYQLDVQTLCKKIGKDIDEYIDEDIDKYTRNVCASNLYFVRTKEESCLKFFLKTLGLNKSNFWGVHKVVLDIVKPACILVIGIGVYDEIKELLGFPKKHTSYEKRSFNERDKLYWYVCDGHYPGSDTPLTLIGIPHPSSKRSSLPLSKCPETMDSIKKECSIAVKKYRQWAKLEEQR
jgi:hypothetical protein